MSTIRLNNHNRRELIQLIVTAGMAAVTKALDEREIVLAERAYNATYSPEERARMHELPAGWLREEDSIHVQTGNSYHELHFGVARRFLAKTERCAYALSAREKLATDIELWASDRKRAAKEREKLRLDTRAVINSVSTVKRLLEVWPEARVFTEQLDLSPPQLPALPIAALNKALGL